DLYCVASNNVPPVAKPSQIKIVSVISPMMACTPDFLAPYKYFFVPSTKMPCTDTKAPRKYSGTISTFVSLTSNPSSFLYDHSPIRQPYGRMSLRVKYGCSAHGF